MKISHFFITFLAAASLLIGCKSAPKVDPDKCAAAADALIETLKPTKAETSDSVFNFTYDVDTIFSPGFAGSPVLKFYLAERFRAHNTAELKDACFFLRDSDIPFDVTITGKDGTEVFNFNGTQLVALRKVARIALDLPAVRAGIINLSENMNAERFKKLDGVQAVTVAMENGFITYTLRFDANKKFDKSNQGLLTQRYEPLFKAQVAALEKVFPGLIETYTSAGIDGFRVQYATGNDATIALREAFPWRVLL